EVGAGEVATGVAIAARIERLERALVDLVADLHDAAGHEEARVPRVAGGDDAVEEIDALEDEVDEIARSADPHEIARPVVGEKRRRDIDDAPHEVRSLAHRDAADRVAGEIEARDLARRALAKLVVRAALNDSEERLVALAGVRSA